MSGGGNRRRRGFYHAAGFSKHLTKPVNIETLESALRQVTGA